MKHEEMEKMIFQLRKETWIEFKEYYLDKKIESFYNWLNQEWKDNCEEYKIDYSVYSEYNLSNTKTYSESVFDIKDSMNYIDYTEPNLDSDIEDLKEFLEENSEDEIQSFQDDYKERFFNSLGSEFFNSNFDNWEGWECCFEEAVKEATGMPFQEFVSKNTKVEDEE